MSTGSTNDISPLLCFHFWEPVGISESVGHAMIFKILMDDTLKVIHWSNVRSALNLHAKNLWLDPLDPGNVATPIVKSHHDSVDNGEILPPMPVIDPLELIRHTFLMDKENGQRHHARILNVINEEEICKHIGKHKRELFSQPGHVQFVYSVNDDDYEEILSYNELMDYIEKDEQQHQDEDTNGFWNFKHIVGHEGPFIELPIQNTRVLDTMFLLSGRMGRSHLNLSISLAMTCAVYACEHRLLEKDGMDSRELRNVKRRW